MKALKCELCGGTEIVKDGDFFVCQKLRYEIYARVRKENDG